MKMLTKFLPVLLLAGSFGFHACDRVENEEDSYNIKYAYTISDHQKFITWIDETIENSRRTGEPAILIDKSAYILHLYDDGELKHSFPVELGFNPYEDKHMEGDGCTPEGKYIVSVEKDQSGQSHYYKALLINYPDQSDWNEFNELQESGEIPLDASIGGAV